MLKPSRLAFLAIAILVILLWTFVVPAGSILGNILAGLAIGIAMTSYLTTK